MKLVRYLLALLMISFALNGCATAPKYQAPAAFAPYQQAFISQPGGFYHTVERGQTLYRIAKMYSVDVSELMRTNNIYNPSTLEVGQRLLIPGKVSPGFASVSQGVSGPLSLEQARSLVGPKSYKYSWQTITVHHSATLQGSAKSFDKNHRRRHMGGLFYHFVIGNGSQTKDGGVEVGWRWRKQVKANRPYDIQICLVGDFNRENVSPSQLSSLVNLILVLQEEYNIPLNNIRRHEDIKGKHTECPGRNFPFDRLLSEVASRKGRF